VGVGAHHNHGEAAADVRAAQGVLGVGDGPVHVVDVAEAVGGLRRQLGLVEVGDPLRIAAAVAALQGLGRFGQEPARVPPVRVGTRAST